MRRSRRGAAAVEFVLTLPILWLVLMVLLEMAMLWEDQRELTRSTLGLARAMSLVGEGDDEDIADVLVQELGIDPDDVVELSVVRSADDVSVQLTVVYDPLIAIWPQGEGSGSLPDELVATVVYPRQDQ